MSTTSRKREIHKKGSEVCNYQACLENGDLSDVALSLEGAEESRERSCDGKFHCIGSSGFSLIW